MNNEGCRGYARICAHRIEWRYEYDPDKPDITELPESEEEHIKQMLCENYTQGELCYSDDNENTYYGWWKIAS